MIDVVTEGLHVLRSTLLLDVCGYLHESHLGGATLVWETPELDPLSPTETFDFMVALNDAARRARDRDDVVHTELLQWPVTLVPSAGSASSGVHVLGRSDAWSAEEIDLAVRLARGLAAGLHLAERFARRGGHRPHAQLTGDAGSYTATAALIAGDRELRGTSAAAQWRVAVAGAVVACFGEDLAVEVAPFRSADADGVVVMVGTEPDTGVGAATLAGRRDEVQCVADAAVRAYNSLRFAVSDGETFGSAVSDGELDAPAHARRKEVPVPVVQDSPVDSSSAEPGSTGSNSTAPGDGEHEVPPFDLPAQRAAM